MRESLAIFDRLRDVEVQWECERQQRLLDGTTVRAQAWSDEAQRRDNERLMQERFDAIECRSANAAAPPISPTSVNVMTAETPDELEEFARMLGGEVGRVRRELSEQYRSDLLDLRRHFEGELASLRTTVTTLQAQITEHKVRVLGGDDRAPLTVN